MQESVNMARGWLGIIDTSIRTFCTQKGFSWDAGPCLPHPPAPFVPVTGLVARAQQQELYVNCH